MKIRFLTKINEHKRFNYKPMYYNERKERLEEMASRYSEEGTSRTTQLRDRLHESWGRGAERQQKNRQANYRFLVILLVLGVLVYVVFSKSQSITQIVDTI